MIILKLFKKNNIKSEPSNNKNKFFIFIYKKIEIFIIIKDYNKIYIYNVWSN